MYEENEEVTEHEPAWANGGGNEAGLKSKDVFETLTKKRRGRPPGSTNRSKFTPNGPVANGATTSKGRGKVLFPTAKDDSDRNKESSEGTDLMPSRRTNRSEKRGKLEASNTLRGITGLGDGMDEDEEGLLVRQNGHPGERDAASSSDEEASDGDVESTLETPSRNRQQKRRRKKSPTTPQNLATQEQYFWANRPGRVKTSNNTLAGMKLLSHEEYHELASSYKDPHAEAYEALFQIHTRSFPQWRFELHEDFNICLYGCGSKRRLVTDFAQYLHEHLPSAPRVFVINGYLSTLNLRNVLTTLATLVFNCKTHDLPSSQRPQPRDITASLVSHLNQQPPDEPIYLFINSLDAAPLRRSPIPFLLAQLACHPSIHMLATCDTPNFPLLWDVGLRDRYNWLFHDTTTFQSIAGVEIGSVVDDFDGLLGRSGRSVKGKDGAGYVLKSLTENARSLYRVLIAEILAAADTSNLHDDQGFDEDVEGARARMELGGIERKALFQKVVEEFICSSEMAFAQLLNEFYDHDMLIDRRDADGANVLGVPWSREECEEILEELMG